LCRSSQLELARKFSDKVLGLRTEYEAYFSEIVALVHECEGLADVMLRVLLSGASDELLKRVASVANLITQKRHTVEWFGRFLVRCGRPCPGVMAILSTLAEEYPERGDDLSGYVQLAQGADTRLLPLFAKNDALFESAITVLVNEGTPWIDIQRFCNGRKSDLELALMCMTVSDIAQPPSGIEQTCGRTEFLAFIQKTKDLTDPKLAAILAKWAGVLFFSGLTHRSKPIRKTTLNFVRDIFRNQNNESPSVCLFRLINLIQNLESLMPGEAGRYVHYFKAMNCVAQLNRKEAKAFRGPLMRTQPKLLSTQATFNQDLLELSRLAIAYFSIRPGDFSELFLAFFRNPAGFSGVELRKALEVFFPTLQRMTLAELRALIEADEFVGLVRRAIAVGTPEITPFIAFVRDLAGQSDLSALRFVALLQD
jgi:hypothetical protein